MVQIGKVGQDRVPKKHPSEREGLLTSHIDKFKFHDFLTLGVVVIIWIVILACHIFRDRETEQNIIYFSFVVFVSRGFLTSCASAKKNSPKGCFDHLSSAPSRALWEGHAHTRKNPNTGMWQNLVRPGESSASKSAKDLVKDKMNVAAEHLLELPFRGISVETIDH